ncbi:fluoride efflux transporter FluC [Nocardioides marmoraquaticus]
MTGLTVVLVAVGGGLGAALRYAAGRALDRGWHLGTLLVNVVGSALLGALVGADAPTAVLTVVGVGVCGGLTTYSAFAVQTVSHARSRRPRRAAAYALVTVGGCLLAATAGWAVAGTLLGTS